MSIFTHHLNLNLLLCIGLFLLVPVQASEDKAAEDPEKAALELKKKKENAVKKFANEELKDFQRLVTLLRGFRNKNDVEKLDKASRKIEQKYKPLYGSSGSGNSHEGGSIKYEGFDITLADLEPVHRRMAAKRRSLYKKYLEAHRHFRIKKYDVGTYEDFSSITDATYWARRVLTIHQTEEAQNEYKKYRKRHGFYY